MIKTKSDLKYYLECDKLALKIVNLKSPRFLRDDIWRYEILLRYCEYYTNNCDGIFDKFLLSWYRFRLSQLGKKLGLYFPINVFGPGLSIAHSGCIVVNSGAKVGKNCRIHEGVTIGATNGSNRAATIGDNVFISTGAKIIGEVNIADDVAIAANAVVVKSIDEPGTTWGGVPARKISNNNSHSNLSKLIKF